MSRRGAFLLQCYLTLAAAMFFQLEEQEEKCIIEEIPIDTLVTGESCRGKKKSKFRIWKFDSIHPQAGSGFSNAKATSDKITRKQRAFTPLCEAIIGHIL